MVQNDEQDVSLLDTELMNRAFVHSSYAHEQGIESNERLEFLGDSVLNFVVTQYLYNDDNGPEGKLSAKRASIVSTDTLAKAIDGTNLFDNIKLGKSYINNSCKDYKSIKADLFEAILGAIFLENGIEQATLFVERMLLNNVALDIKKDYKTTLQEYFQSRSQEFDYRTERIEEEDCFESEVVSDNEVLGIGRGKSKKDAQYEAAKNALLLLNKS